MSLDLFEKAAFGGDSHRHRGTIRGRRTDHSDGWRLRIAGWTVIAHHRLRAESIAGLRRGSWDVSHFQHPYRRSHPGNRAAAVRIQWRVARPVVPGGADRSYVLQQIRRWFTLFFIPLFPAGKMLRNHFRGRICGPSS